MFHLIYPTTCGARGHFSSINLKQQGSNIWHKIKKCSGEHVYKIVYNLCGGKYSGENFLGYCQGAESLCTLQPGTTQ